MKVPPPGDRILCNTPTTDIDNDEPQDEEILTVVVVAKRGKAKGINLVQAKNINVAVEDGYEEDYEEEVRKEEEETGIPWDPTKPLKCAGWGY